MTEEERDIRQETPEDSYRRHFRKRRPGRMGVLTTIAMASILCYVIFDGGDWLWKILAVIAAIMIILEFTAELTWRWVIRRRTDPPPHCRVHGR